MLMIGLVGNIPDCQPQALVFRELPGCPQIGGDEPRRTVFRTIGKAGGDTFLLIDQAQREIALDAGHDLTDPAKRDFIRRHLEQWLVHVVVLAADARVAGVQPVAAGDLPGDPGFDALDRRAAEVDRLLAVARVGRAASGGGGGAGVKIDPVAFLVSELVNRALAAGLLINVTAEKIVRLLPALNFSADDARELVQRLGALIREFLSS